MASLTGLRMLVNGVETNTVDLSGGAATITFVGTGTTDIADVIIDFNAAGGFNFLGGTFSFGGFPDDFTDGQSQGSEQVQPSQHDGTFTVADAIVFDSQGHQIHYTAAQLQQLGLDTSIVVTHADSIGPTLTALNLPTQVAPGGALTITASATDLHGVERVVIDFDKNITAGGTAFDLFGTDDSWADGTSTHSETVPLNATNGTYTIHDIKLTDTLGNVTTLTTAQLVAAGFQTTVTVTPGDTTPPDLTGLSFPSTVNVSGGGKAVTFFASGTDNATGISDVLVHFDKDLITGATTGGLVNISGAGDSWTDGASSIAENIPSTAKAGVYTVTSVDVFDGAGNKHTYSNADLTQMHFSTTLTIESNPATDTTPPDLLTLTFPKAVNLTDQDFIDFFATAHDTSGIDSLTVWFDHSIDMDFSGFIDAYPGFILDGTNGDSWSDGGSSGELVLPESDAFDVVLIDHIDLVDTVGNSRTYTNADLPGLGINTGFVLFNNQIQVLPADVLPGTTGNDNIHGNANDNFIWGGPGDDILSCGGGSDWLDGGPGDDTYNIISSSDHIIENANEGFDRVFVQVNYVLQVNVSIEFIATSDVSLSIPMNITGNAFAQTINGNNGDNVLDGGGGLDHISGFGGDDRLIGESGTEVMAGGTGDDLYIVVDVNNSVVENFDEGVDTVQTVLASYTMTAYVEKLICTSGIGHTITGNASDNVIFGNAGIDTLSGGAGNDTLVGNSDIFASVHDILNGGDGNDTLLGEVSDTISGGAGIDTLQAVNSNPWSINLATTSIEIMLAGFGNDQITAAGQTTGCTIFAQGGNDSVTGSGFADFLWGGVGNDTLVGGAGNDLLFGDLGADSLSGGDGNDTLYADSSDTHIDGGAGFDALYWAAGVAANINLATDAVEFVQTLGTNDILNGGSSTANLIVFAGAGNDTVTGGSGADFLWGEAGNDTLVGNGGNDTLVGGLGTDKLTGGAGTDNLFGNSGGGGDGAVDTFVFTANWGTDFVYDFDNGTDKLDMTALHTNFASLTVTTVGAHAEVSLGANHIIVVGQAGHIDAGDFLF
jgi:Ca2+-binding RTX toxin-like protein